jgi:hypothetical protein
VRRVGDNLSGMDEQPRPDANAEERTHTLTVEEVLMRYDAAGHARTARAIQKYCVRGDLDCMKEETTYGQRYQITPASVARHLQQIEEISRTKRREQPRPDANVRIEEIQNVNKQKEETNIREQPRPDATESRYVTQLESDLSFLRDQITRKDRQIEQRDNQIGAMIERDRETNILIKGLQERIPQLAQSDKEESGRNVEVTMSQNQAVDNAPGDNS